MATPYIQSMEEYYFGRIFKSFRHYISNIEGFDAIPFASTIFSATKASHLNFLARVKCPKCTYRPKCVIQSDLKGIPKQLEVSYFVL